MKKLLKNKAVLIGGTVALVIVVILIGAFVFLSKSNNSQANQDQAALPTQIPIPTIKPDSIGLTLKYGVPGQTVIASISNVEGISAINYELDYTAKNSSTLPDAIDRIPRQVRGDFNLSQKPVSETIKLGTCSDVCHYDQEVQDIKVVLKITKSDGKIYQSESPLSPQTP